MTAAEIVPILQAQFPDAVSGVSGGPDLSVTVEPAKLVEVCTFLRDDSRLKFEILNDISGVDYLEIDPKKVAKAGFEPHVEVVYHLSSFSFPGRRFTVKVILPRWKDNIAGQLPEVPSVAKRVEDGRLAGARGVRLDRRELHRASESGADFARG